MLTSNAIHQRHKAMHAANVTTLLFCILLSIISINASCCVFALFDHHELYSSITRVRTPHGLLSTPSIHSFHHNNRRYTSCATATGFCSTYNGGSSRCNTRRIQHYRMQHHRPASIIHDPKKVSSSSLFLGNQNEDDAADDTIKTQNNNVPIDTSSSIKDDDHNWTSQTLAIALPALAGMMTDPMLSMVDTLYVGRLGYASSSSATSTSSIPLAALGACTSIFHLSFHCFRATTLSTSSLVAGALVRDEQQRNGQDYIESNDEAEDEQSITSSHGTQLQKEAVLIAQTSIQQALFTGVLITAFLLTFGPRCLLAMGIPQGGQLYDSAITYLNWRSLAAPAVVMLSASEGIFRGYGDVITPWKVSCVVAVLNLILDPFCMFGGGGRFGRGLGMGIKGAAVATAFSQLCGAFLYGRWLSRKGLVGGKGKKDGGGGIIGLWKRFQINSRRGGNTETNSGPEQRQRAALKRQKRTIATTILRANAAMMAKQGSLLIGWAYATSRATRMGHLVVASHQMALSIWLVVSFVLEGAGVAAQVLMAREWEGLKLLLKSNRQINKEKDDANKEGREHEAGPYDYDLASEPVDKQRRTIKSLSLYMVTLSVVQGLIGSLAILLLRQSAPSFILTHDPAVRQNLLTLLPHIAAQMALVSVTLVTEALVIGGGRFKWLAGGTTVSSIIAIAKLRGAKDLVGIWNGGIVALFLGRLATAMLALLDMNGCFRWRKPH